MKSVTPGNAPVLVDPNVVPVDGSTAPESVSSSRCSDRPKLQAGCVILAAALWLTAGCGIGTDFTGGSIPPGGTRLFGRVAAAENPLLPLANVMVNVESRPVTGGIRTLRTVTRTDGSFDFISVATGSTSSTMTVTVTPDAAAGRQAQQVVFRADNGRTDNLVVALPLNSFDVKSAVKLTILDLATLPPGDSETVHTRLLDASMRRLPVQPTLLFSGNFGSFSIDETFAATATGVGTVTAFWYSLPAPSTTITVDANAAHLPPSPPDLPPALTSLDPVPNPPAGR